MIQMELKHVISTRQFLDKGVLKGIFDLASEMEKNDREGKVPQTMKGRVMATVFYEPSTRTRFSFEAAMSKLGGRVVSTENASEFSSAIKGESLRDTIKIMNGYADLIVLRHPDSGSAEIASEVSDIPVINAGDGIGEHPTQALLDLYTIIREKGNVDGLEVGIVGDLLYGRTVHSLVNLLTMYKVKVYLISPERLRIPQKYKDRMKAGGVEFHETEKAERFLDRLDVLYVTRIQKERFESREEYEKIKDSFVFDRNRIEHLKDDAIIMHPLPRVNEISPEVDRDHRAAYFRQARNGLYIRMALLQKML